MNTGNSRDGAATRRSAAPEGQDVKESVVVAHSEERRQSAAPRRIPLLANLTLDRQTAAGRCAEFALGGRGSVARTAAGQVIAHCFVATMPTAQMLFNRTLIHARSSLAAI